jgi:hypothetical protein
VQWFLAEAASQFESAGKALIAEEAGFLSLEDLVAVTEATGPVQKPVRPL